MTIVLGIDAAWTNRNPSGVALAVHESNTWQLKGAYTSYEELLRAANYAPETLPTAGTIEATQLIAATRSLAGGAPDLVTVDMPLALTPIERRRSADTAISRAYGAKGCATHSPNASRPGNISDRFREQFAKLGYPLCINAITRPGLIEVYPHPALVELCDEKKRLPYKLARVRTYWPKLTPHQRRAALLAEWGSIATVLEGYLKGSEEAMYRQLSLERNKLKGAEDMLDAIVCCVVGIRALEGAAVAYAGDATAAIWVPKADKAIQERTLLPSSPYSARAELRIERFTDDLYAGKYRDLFPPPEGL